MVRDSKPFSQRKQLKRRSSWKDTLRGWASGEDQAEEKRPRRSSLNWRAPPKVADKQERRGVRDEGSLADNETSEDEDFNQYPEQDRPIRARVLYRYSSGRGEELPRSKSAMERQQLALSEAVEQANTKATQEIAGNGFKPREPIGTRLTMTSRTGYFQDRIVSPSMVCSHVSSAVRAFQALNSSIDACYGYPLHRAPPKPRFL